MLLRSVTTTYVSVDFYGTVYSIPIEYLAEEASEEQKSIINYLKESAKRLKETSCQN